MLSNLQKLSLSNTQISGTIPREISMLSNLQLLAFVHTASIEWHNSSRDIDAEQFADIGFVQHEDQWHNSSRDIDAEQFAELYLPTRRSVAQSLERYRC